MSDGTISISGIRIRRSGTENDPYAQVILEVEVDGKWYKVASEYLESNFSTIIEPAGIRRVMLRSHASESIRHGDIHILGIDKAMPEDFIAELHEFPVVPVREGKKVD